jgi:hypothetical protein
MRRNTTRVVIGIAIAGAMAGYATHRMTTATGTHAGAAGGAHAVAASTATTDIDAARRPDLATEPAPADFDVALLESPQAQDWRAFVAFQDEAITFLREADALPLAERRQRADALARAAQRFEADRRLLPFEALEFRTALVDRTEPDPALAARAKDALRRAHAESVRVIRERETAERADALARYRAAEAGVLAESRNLSADERARYLQERLIHARSAAFAPAAGTVDR